VFVAILSGPLLGEKVRPLVWLVSAIALTGVALILRPNLAALGVVALLPLASAFFFALMVIMNRASAGQDSSLSMQAFIALWATPFLIAAAAIGHASGLPSLSVGLPDWSVIARCALVALTASSAHWLAYLGTMRAGAATIAPVTYVQMLVATTLGYALFDDVPDLATFAGAGIIIGAGLILWARTPRKAAIREPSGLTGPT
ncbi:MAG: EamA/RhaT family transporter, partial [Erythrobacter sp.]|nr:EamA/RhaT family transporter [Erythrobacter sp.]